MNPKYLWLTGALQLLSFFVVGPIIATAIAMAWRRKSLRLNRSGTACVASGVAAVLLFVTARYLDADVREAKYFLQLACVILSGLLFGVCMGCGVSVFSCLWSWHKATQLTGYNQGER